MSSVESVFEKVCKKLSGRTGLVYLMFLGRENYTAKVKETLLETQIYANSENVYQAVERMLVDDELYLKFLGEKRVRGGPGRAPNIYTASFEPVFNVLRRLKVDFNREHFESLIKSLSFLNDNFPVYFVKTITWGSTSFFKLGQADWTHTLSTYLRYLGFSLLTSEQRRRNKSLKKPPTALIEKEPVLNYILALIPLYQPYIMEYQKKLKKVFERYPRGGYELFNIGLSLSVKTLGGEFEAIGQSVIDFLKRSLQLTNHTAR